MVSQATHTHSLAHTYSHLVDPTGQILGESKEQVSPNADGEQDHDAPAGAGDAGAANGSDIEYEYDVFLSFRVSSDQLLTKMLYEKLRVANPTLRIFFAPDRLQLGEAFAANFTKALTQSRVFVCVISRGTFSCEHGSLCRNCNSNVAQLAGDREDSVLVEHDLALELFEMGRVKKIVPLFVGDVTQPHRDLGVLYANFFDSFKPCINWDTVPSDAQKSQAVRKRAIHMLQKDSRLRSHMNSRRDMKTLVHPLLREGTPTLLEGRSAKQTIQAITSMHGITLLGIKDRAINDAVEKIGTVAEEAVAKSEGMDGGVQAGPKMEHTAVEILVDAFRKVDHNPEAKTAELAISYHEADLVLQLDKCPGLQVYESGVKVEYDYRDGLGAVLIRSGEVSANETSVHTWNAKAYKVDVAGRRIKRSSIFS